MNMSLEATALTCWVSCKTGEKVTPLSTHVMFVEMAPEDKAVEFGFKLGGDDRGFRRKPR
jgi:hypothetical protein